MDIQTKSNLIPIKRAYKYRIYPTKEQKQRLEETLSDCCRIYNFCKEKLDEKISRNEIQRKIKFFVNENPPLKRTYQKAFYMENYKLFSALWGLSRSKKRGRKVGALKFKSRRYFNAFTYQQGGWELMPPKEGKSGKINLSKIGDIKAIVHRLPLPEARQKSITISKENENSWYASIACEEEVRANIRNNIKPIGIDMGLTYIIFDSSGRFVKNPYFWKRDSKKIKKLQRDLARKEKYSKNWKRAKIKLNNKEKEVDRRKEEFFKKIARYYVNNYNMIFYENLNIFGMKEKKKGDSVINKNIRRHLQITGWTTLIRWMKVMGERADVRLIAVEPKDTTQGCFRCDKIVEKEIKDRIHMCPYCGLEIGRDYNAALNILKRGLIGQGLSEFMPVELPEPSSLNLDLNGSGCLRSRKERESSMPIIPSSHCRPLVRNALSGVDGNNKANEVSNLKKQKEIQMGL